MSTFYKVNDLETSGFSIPDSWVALGPSSRGSSSSITTCTESGGYADTKLLLEAQRDASSRGGSCQTHSPKSLTSPGGDLEDVRKRLKEDLLPPGKDSDWIWDWSLRKELPITTWRTWKHRGYYGDPGITPPNSPAPQTEHCHWSLRHNRVLSSRCFSAEILSVIIMTNILSVLIGVGIGFLVGRYLAQ